MEGKEAGKGLKEGKARIGGHGRTVLIAEPILRPHARLAMRPMHSIDEAVALSFLRSKPVVLRVAQQARRHAWPGGEDDKGEQVTDGHCSSSGFIQPGPSRTTIRLTYCFLRLWF